MNRFVRTLLCTAFFLSSVSSFSQQINRDSIIDRKIKDARIWASSLKKLDLLDQWKAITSKYFNPQKDSSLPSYYKNDPTLVIDQHIVPHWDLNSTTKKALKELLAVEFIEKIEVVEKEPKGLYINKAFTGYILVTLKNKKVKRKFRKIIQ